MARKYPPLLTLTILLVATIAAGAGLLASSGVSVGTQGSPGIADRNSGGELCTYSNASSQATVIDEITEVGNNDTAQIGFTIPKNNAAVRIKLRPLTVTTPQVVISKSDGNVVFQSSLTEPSERDIANAEPGNYQIQIINEAESRLELSVKIQIGVC